MNNDNNIVTTQNYSLTADRDSICTCYNYSIIFLLFNVSTCILYFKVS